MRRGVTLAIALATGLSACDDQIKYIPIFSTMAEQPSIEAFEGPPRTAVPGTMPVDGRRTVTLAEAQTLANPLRGSDEEIAAGAELFGQFCTPCHGVSARGDGPVVGPNRLPSMPTMDLLGARAVGLSDGFLYWKIAPDTPGVMPSYKRIPRDQRWYIVSYIRDLQRRAGAGGDE